MTEERDDVVVLVDEDGEEVEFEHLDTIEMNNNEYVVLLPVGQDEEEIEEDVDEVVILKVEHGDGGEDSFINVEDDQELNLVFEEFKSRMEQEYDFD
ncbi:MAG: DUF1292 domain-containing protein [Clostridia bacterium]|nr:DUF1292 domain-containing protein [Clostridia bacterium]